MSNIRDEQLVDVRPLPQSAMKVMPGGDCGYCCVGGLLELSDVLQAYEVVERTMPEGSWRSRQSMHPSRWREFLEGLGMTFRPFNPAFDHYKDGVPEVPWLNNNWAVEFEQLVERGCVLVGSIRFERSVFPDPTRGSIHDHNVLITGYRVNTVPHPTVPRAWNVNKEIRIACSNKGEYWMEIDEFLYWHGASFHVIDVQAMRGAWYIATNR